MGIREMAAQHRQTIIGSSSCGCGVLVRCFPDSGEPFNIKGVWSESRSDERNPNGIGAEASFSRTTLTISVSDCPTVTRKWQFHRLDTGETWEVEQATLQTGIGWKIQLTRADRARISGMR